MEGLREGPLRRNWMNPDPTTREGFCGTRGRGRRRG